MSRVRVHVGEVDAPLARIIPIGQRHTHRVARVARQRVVIERVKHAVAAVVPHEVAAEVVPLEQVQVAVAVEVEELRDVGVARPRDPPLVGLLGKAQPAVVDEEQVVGAVVGVDAVEHLGAARPVGLVAAHEDVEPAVAVHVAGGHELRLVAPDARRVVERQGARQVDPFAVAARVDAHPRPAGAIRHAAPGDLLEAVAVQVHEQVLAGNEQVFADRQGLPKEAAPPVVEEEDAVAGDLGSDDVPVAVPVPVDHAQRGIDQAHAGIGYFLPQLAVLWRPVEMQADRVRDVPKRWRRIADAERIRDVQTEDLPGLGARLDQLRGDGRLDHGPRPRPVRAAQPDVGARKRALAVRRQQELEHLPRRAIDRNPGLDVRAQRRQEPVAIERRQCVRFVAVNGQRSTVDRTALLRGWKPSAKSAAQRTCRQIPVEAAYSRDQGRLQAVLDVRLRLLGNVEVGHIARRRRQRERGLGGVLRLRRGGRQSEQDEQAGRCANPIERAAGVHWKSPARNRFAPGLPAV